MASEFRVKFRLQGLELELQGARQDLPQITHNLASQIAGLIQPASRIVEGRSPTPMPSERLALHPEPANDAGKSRPRKKSPVAQSASSSEQGKAVDWRH